MGLVHGALRPCNVMVLEDGRVKLMDLELAGLRDARPTDGSLVAKPSAEYLSPEQICRAPVTEKTDIYSFAVILYEMLCGVPPFQAETRDAVLEKHLTEPPPPMRPRRAVPASVESIVTQALDKQPGLRPLMQDVLNGLWSDAHRPRSEEHTSELQSRLHLVCRLLLEKKKNYTDKNLSEFDVSRHDIR